MSMVKSVVFQGQTLIGEVEVTLNPQMSYLGRWLREIRVTDFSPPSCRCPPLAVFLTISTEVLFRMESLSPSYDDSPLATMHEACLKELKTAVVPLGGEEIHLVAMPSRKQPIQYSCFWGFSVVPRLYTSCLAMLNMRCLGIVFDLDETLMVANTMRSFDDRIDALHRKINTQMDHEQIISILSEVKRYQDDKAILKQYVENDQVVENGKVYVAQLEIVPPLSSNSQVIIRPVIRLQHKNIILTRVNPRIRDTSVLVRLRPAWDDLRSYLIEKGRKRFQAYVCTMAERDYALEMWRLLDPESNLINHRELLDRIECVKSGSKKSLLDVFKDGVCHPSMGLVIDDRLDVWNEKDQPRVHVVPTFVPYHAPSVEANDTIPVLCVARKFACNVRLNFFKEFDERILPKLSNIFFEDEMNFQAVPNVGNYVISEDNTSMLESKKDSTDVKRRMKDSNYNVQAIPSLVNYLEPMTMPRNNQCLQHSTLENSFTKSMLSESISQGLGATEEGEVPESELDPNTRRRLLILQHGQDTSKSPLNHRYHL